MSRNKEADDIQELFDHNREWAAQMERDDPGFFGRLARQQEPDFLWIGCSDSRVPASQITGLMPGEVFVHRNVANVVMQTDPNCMSVVDFAIRKLEVRHVIVCGHYGCAGVNAAMGDTAVGTVDQWLSGIHDLWEQHREFSTFCGSAAPIAVFPPTKSQGLCPAKCSCIVILPM